MNNDTLFVIDSIQNTFGKAPQTSTPAFSPVSKRNKRIDLGILGKKLENLHTGSVFRAEED